MTTLANTRNRIADDLNRSDLTSQINTAINRAIKHYEMTPFWFREEKATFATVAGQKIYTTSDGIPTDISEIVYAEVSDNNGTYQLTQRSVDWVEINNPDDGQGVPTDFAFFENSIYLYPVPDAVRTVTLFYIERYAELSADADTNSWLTNAQDLIEARARYWLNLRVLLDEMGARGAKIEEEEALAALWAKHTLIKNETIEPTRF